MKTKMTNKTHTYDVPQLYLSCLGVGESKECVFKPIYGAFPLHFPSASGYLELQNSQTALLYPNTGANWCNDQKIEVNELGFAYAVAQCPILYEDSADVSVFYTCDTTNLVKNCDFGKDVSSDYCYECTIKK